MLKNTLKYIVVKILEWEAKLVLRKYKPKIIGVTGSVGKTSVKDAVYSVLSTKYKVRKSAKSYNSELGVPLTILNRETAWLDPLGWLKNIFEGLALFIFPHDYPNWLVLEIGADRPGDIQKVCAWLKPDIAIITRLPDLPVHIEFFPSKESLIKEKLALAKSIGPTGTVILNIDDENIRPAIDQVKGQVLTYGFSDKASVRASDYHLTYKTGEALETVEGLTFKLNYSNDIIPIRVSGTIGQHHVYTILAAIAIGLSQGLNVVEISEALASYATPPGRMKILEGIKGSTIIDDSYNASPVAMEAGIEALADIKTMGRKIAVLGDMLELGEYTIEAHKAIGRLLVDKVSILVAVGVRAKFIIEGAQEAGFSMDNVFHFADALSAGKKLQNLIKAGDIIYIKGSQLMRLERTIEEIMLHPDQKEKLLCRQELEWKDR